MRIRVGDTVEIIAGNDTGQRGKVLKVDHKHGKLVVEGMNRAFKHLRRSQKNPQGGRLSKEMPLQVSNVMLVCTACSQASRVGNRVGKDGSKERFCKKCNATISRVAPPRKKAAAKA
jgi:large subunit ribosomal protein L24